MTQAASISAKDISIVAVIYNSFDVLAGFLASIPKGQDVVVVDNGSDDGGRALAREFGANLVVSEDNVGFGAGCNAGAREAQGKAILFLNPDARLQEDTLEQLAGAMQRHPEAAGFGAVLLDEAGHVSFKRGSRLKAVARLPKKAPESDVVAPALSGAAMLVPKAAFEAVGGFDEAMFLFYEDDDLSLRLSDKIGPLFLVPSAKVVHIGGESSGSNLSLSAFKGYHWGRSRVYASAKHGSAAPLLRGLINGLNFLMSRKSIGSAARRAEAIGRIKGAWSMRASKERQRP